MVLSLINARIYFCFMGASILQSDNVRQCNEEKFSAKLEGRITLARNGDAVILGDGADSIYCQVLVISNTSKNLCVDWQVTTNKLF